MLLAAAQGLLGLQLLIADTQVLDEEPPLLLALALDADRELFE